MLSHYTNLYFPICSFVVSLLIFILFFSKQKEKNKETSIYSKLVITGLCESSLYTFICLIAHFYFNDENLLLFEILNKVLYSIYIIWFSLLSIYITDLYLENNKVRRKGNLLYSIFMCIDIILITLICLLRVDIFYDSLTGLSNSYGPSANVLYFGIVLYLIYMSVMVILDLAKYKNMKYIPYYLLIILMIITMVIRVVDPLFSIYSNVLSLTLLVMYFTIENPDIKLARELNVAKTIAENSRDETISTLNNMSVELKRYMNEVKKINDQYKSKEDDKLINFISSFTDKVSDLIELGKINSENYALSEQPYEIYNTIDEIKHIIKIDERNKNLDFDFEVDDNISKILYGDKDKIKQIVLYFSRYLASKIKKENIKVKISKVVAGNLCKLKMTFIIFSPEVDELVNVNKRTRRHWLKKVNDDIDYDIINSLLKKVDGTISIKKEEEHTEITISITQRIMKEYNTNNEEIDEKNIIPFNSNEKKIIIADTNQSRIDNLIDILKLYNVDISICHSITEVHKDLKRHQYYLVLIDDMMPKEYEDMTEEDRIRSCSTKLFQKFNDVSVPVVIMVTKNKKRLEKKYLDYDFDDYIIKPINKKSINSIMKKYLKDNNN
ncbi:MAG: hypothetical protein ACI4U4_04190 [Bacilli bacterium]